MCEILYTGFRATLNIQIFKVALKPMYRIKNPLYQNSIIKNGFHRAIFEI